MFISVSLPKYVAEQPIAKFGTIAGVVVVNNPKPKVAPVVTMSADTLFEVGLKEAAAQIKRVDAVRDAKAEFEALFQEVK